jgi:hypothetical protein
MQMASTDSDTTTATKARTATPRKIAATRSAVKPAPAPASSTSTQPASTVLKVQHLAERAVLMQVGAGLVIRDGVVSTVKGLASNYTTRSGLERQLGRYEKRGTTARNRFERQLRRRRKVVLQRRSSVERTFVESRARFEKLVSNAQELIGSIS